MYVCYKSETSFLSSLLHHGHFLVFYQTPHLTIKYVNKSDLCHYSSNFMWLLSVIPTPSVGRGLFPHGCSVSVVCKERGRKGMLDAVQGKGLLHYVVHSSNWSRKKQVSDTSHTLLWFFPSLVCTIHVLLLYLNKAALKWGRPVATSFSQRSNKAVKRLLLCIAAEFSERHQHYRSGFCHLSVKVWTLH